MAADVDYRFSVILEDLEYPAGCPERPGCPEGRDVRKDRGIPGNPEIPDFPGKREIRNFRNYHYYFKIAP